MGRKGALRIISAVLRRQQREAMKRARAAEKRLKAEIKLLKQERAAAEVELFECQIEALVSMHRECVDPIDWTAMLTHPLPSPPEPESIDRLLSEEARAAIASHSQSMWGRWFGAKRRKRLEQELTEALEVEQDSQRQAQKRHEEKLGEYERAIDGVLEARELAKQILAGDLKSQAEVVSDSGCLQELAGTLGQVHFDLTLDAQRATIVLEAKEDAIVPSQNLTLTSTGKVSRRKFAAKRRMEIYEDYVCGAALRAAREIMAVIPIPAVLVHVKSERVEPSTGHVVPCVILSVLVPREVLSRVDWDLVDASELVKTLLHNMKLKRGKGFQPVEKLTFDDP